MNKVLPLGMLILGMAACGSDKSEITIQMPSEGAPQTIIVNRDLISDLAVAREQTDLKTQSDTLEIKNGKLTIPTDPRGDARYLIQLGDNGMAELYTAPGESLNLQIESYNPLIYSVTGSQLMEDISGLKIVTDSIYNQFAKLSATGEVSDEQIRKYMADYDKALTGFIQKNPDSPAVIFAMFELQGESFKKAYDNLSEQAKKSILMPIITDQVNRMNEQSEEMQRIENERAEKAKGDKMAPDFSLKDPEGKLVSLSQFRGKWVILDFWGTWCGWCVKGIPALKEAYKKYNGKLEVISIDCNETEQEWLDGIKQYELPWVNVINNPEQNLLQAYSISGFPTKAIVNPQGKLVDITVGEDPSFYDRLAKFIKSN